MPQRNVSSINIKITGSTRDLQRAVGSAVGSLDRLGRQSRNTGGSFSIAGSKLAGYIKRVIAAMIIIQGLRKALEQLADTVRLAAAAQTAEVAFRTMIGSAQGAKDLLEDIYHFVRVTPFRLEDVRDGARTLIAFGFSAKEVIPALKSLGDLAAGVGVPLSELTTLIGKARVEGKQYTRDLRQFATAGIPIYDELAKQLGVTTSQVTKFAEEGQIGARHVEAAIASLTTRGAQFGGLMEDTAKTLEGAWSNLLDAFDGLKRTLGTNFIPTLTEITLIMQNLVDMADKWAEGWSNTGSYISAAIGELQKMLPKWAQIIDFQGVYERGIENMKSANDELAESIEGMKPPQFFDPQAELAANKAVAALKEMDKEGKRLQITLADKLRTPLEEFENTIRELAVLTELERIDGSTLARGIQMATDELNDSAEKLDNVLDKALGFSAIGTQEGFAARFSLNKALVTEKPAPVKTKEELEKIIKQIQGEVAADRQAKIAAVNTVTQPLLNEIDLTTKKAEKLALEIKKMFLLIKTESRDADLNLYDESKLADMIADLKELLGIRKSLTQQLGGIDDRISVPVQPDFNIPGVKTTKEEVRDELKSNASKAEYQSVADAVTEGMRRRDEYLRKEAAKPAPAPGSEASKQLSFFEKIGQRMLFGFLEATSFKNLSKISPNGIPPVSGIGFALHPGFRQKAAEANIYNRPAAAPAAPAVPKAVQKAAEDTLTTGGLGMAGTIMSLLSQSRSLYQMTAKRTERKLDNVEKAIVNSAKQQNMILAKVEANTAKLVGKDPVEVVETSVA